ncbi:MAG: MFS transporter, partial [Halobacteria archaeon]|nr:MFS transporter [Halobacteria archaeon]
LAWLIITSVEGLTFFYVFRLNPRYKILLIVGALLYAFKYAVYYFTTSPLVVLVSSLVAGASFGAYYLAAVNLANELAPESLQSTAQTLLWASVFGFGAGAGQLAAGRLYDIVGVKNIWQSVQIYC